MNNISDTSGSGFDQITTNILLIIIISLVHPYSILNSPSVFSILYSLEPSVLMPLRYYQLFESWHSCGFTCVFLRLSLAGFCVAEEAPKYSLYIQSGESSITEDSDGLIQITIQDVVTYIFSANGNKSPLLPIRSVSLYSFHMDVALVYST